MNGCEAVGDLVLIQSSLLLSCNAPINSKLQHLPPPPRANHWVFELLKIGLLKFPPLQAKIVFKCPTLSRDLSVCPKLLKTFFVSQSLTNAISLPLNSSISFKHVFYGCYSDFGAQKKSFETGLFRFNFPHSTQAKVRFPRR